MKKDISMRFSASSAFYDQIDPRRRQELKDSRMIQEDHSKMSNLSDRYILEQFNPDTFKFDQNKAARPVFIFNDQVEGE